MKKLHIVCCSFCIVLLVECTGSRQTVRESVERRGPAHLTMVSRKTSQLCQPVFNPGQHTLLVFIAGYESTLTGTHIPMQEHT